MKLIDQIYAAAVDASAWPAAITAIADALGARAMSLTVADPAGTSAPYLVAPRTDPEWLRAYWNRWAAGNLVRDRGIRLPLREVYRFETLLPRAEFERSPFYNEFLAPQQLNFGLITNTAKEETAISAIGFYRSSAQGRFGPEEERLLRELSPHLQRAVTLNLRLARIEMQRSSTVEMLNRCEEGALLVDADARVLFANAAAEGLMRRGATLRTDAGRLATSAASTTAALRSMIGGRADLISGGVLVLGGADGSKLTVAVVPMPFETSWLTQRPAAIVLVRAPHAKALPSVREIRTTFDLTPAQAALARELLDGDGIPAAADRLGISRSTARTHLLKLFQKTDTSRQAELVRRILERTPVEGAPETVGNGKESAWYPSRSKSTVVGCLAALADIGNSLMQAVGSH